MKPITADPVTCWQSMPEYLRAGHIQEQGEYAKFLRSEAELALWVGRHDSVTDETRRELERVCWALRCEAAQVEELLKYYDPAAPEESES